MSQSIYFARINYFSGKFAKAHKYDELLKELKKFLKEKEEKIEDLLEKIIVDIEIPYLTLSAYTPEIEKFLTKDSEVQLHPQFRYYFVTEELWQVLKKEIFNQNQKNIKKEDDFFKLAEDYMEIKKYYCKKLLVFEAS